MSNESKQKKILLVITKSNWGGAQKYVFDIATSLDPKKYSIKVLAGGNGKMIEMLREKGISVISIDGLDRDIDVKKDFQTFKDILKIFRDERPDIVHLNSSKIGGLGSIAGRLAKVPRIIFTAHGFAFNENRSFISKLVIKVLYWITMYMSHQTITVSEAMKNYLNDWPLLDDKITVVRNGIRNETGYSKTHARSFLEKASPDLSLALKKTKATDIIWLGSIAELHHIKGLNYAIQGVALLIKKWAEVDPKKKIIYTIIGGGEEKSRLESEIGRLGLSKNVFLLGPIMGAREYIKAFDIMLIPSLSEGLCYVALEAGYASMPVVATSVGGIPEIIDDMKSGILVQPAKERDLYHALEFLINHPGVQKEQAKALHDKVTKTFTVEKMLEETEALY